MKPADDIERIIKDMSFQAGPEANQRVWADTRKAQEQAQVRTAAPSGSRRRRQIMRNPHIRWAAAAMIAVAVALSMSLWDKSIPAAYALEQTIQASHSVRYLEIRDFEKGREGAKEFWLEFDEAGRVKNIRAAMPEWESPGDGARVTVWQQGKAKVWYKNKKTLWTIKEERFANEIVKTVQLFDPKLALQRFSDLEKQGLAKVEIYEPVEKTEPIIVTSTNSAQVKEAGYQVDRTLLFVDRATKLVTRVEHYRLAPNGGYELLGWTEFHGYNQPIDPALFALDEVPGDVMRIDRTTQEIGLEQGNLSDEEIAVKVVREFYEAVIAKDYAKAGRLLEGLPAASMEEMFKDLEVVRIVSISEPKPHPSPGVGGFLVPCQLEIEKNGVRSLYEPYGPGVRPVRDQLNRWDIHGGVK
jgi:hypothetical protein